jgi:2TM domain
MFHGKHWHFFPLIGWGFGLAIHGAVVWVKCSSAGFSWRERMLVRERAALNNQGL